MVADQAPSRRGRPRDAAIDRAVVDACGELLAEVGREALSREKVARRARVSVMAVYRRFASVEELLVRVASTPLPRRTAPRDTGTLRGDLTDLLRRRIGLLIHPAAVRGAAELLAAAAGSEPVRRSMLVSLAKRREETLEVLRRGAQRGELRGDADLDLIMDMLEGLVYYRLLWRSAPLEVMEIEGVLDAVLQGAAP